ncbi:MAG: spore coat protein U domain-containing protein [Desulfuromonadales bacterium]|nr:spore coat protein U domain-containing protein [Desulfuromonadales bacterium]
MKNNRRHLHSGYRIALGRRAVCRLALAFTLVFLWGEMTLAWSAACRITATAINFGVYDMLSFVPKDATAQLTIRCNHKNTEPASVRVTLSAGGAGSVGQRRMTGPQAGSFLYYNLFSNPGMSSIFGDDTAGSESLTNLVDRSAVWTVPIYGRIPPLQAIPIGIYSDAVTATILY